MRSAISPRLAIRILSNGLSDGGVGHGQAAARAAPACAGQRRRASADHEQRLAELDGLAVLDEDRLDRAGGVGLDLVHQLHRLDDAQRVALLDRVADLDERLGAGRRRAIERADHRALDDVAFRRRRRGGLRRRDRRDRRGRHGIGWAAWNITVCGPGAPARVMRTRSSPSWISSSAMPEVSTSSISVLSLRRSMEDGGSRRPPDSEEARVCARCR